MRNFLTALFLLWVSVWCCGCPSSTQIAIQTSDVLVPEGATTIPPNALKIPHPGATVRGDVQQGPGLSNNPSGTQASYGPAETNSLGLYAVNDAVVPAYWEHFVNFYNPLAPASQACAFGAIPVGNTEPTNVPGMYYSGNDPMYNGSIFEWDCAFTPSQLPQGFAQFAMNGATPASLTLQSNGATLTTSYGMPRLLVSGVDANGNPINTFLTATAVSSNSSSATFPFPTNSNGSALPVGLYGAALANIASDGSLAAAGPNVLTIGGAQYFNHPFGVGAQVVQYSWYSSTTADPYGDQTCAGGTQYYSGTNSSAYPVVTQYNSASVSFNGSTIAVGANPTAIVLYDSQDDSRYDQNGPCSYSGSDTTYMRKALVANTGASVVSVVDLDAGAVVASIGVGANPSSIALSADESSAFIANSGDNSISKIDLASYTEAARVAVGSKPQSVVIAGDGSVWVGGSGFLTHLNTNMQVMGTYSAAGSVVAMGYNGVSGEIVANLVRSNGMFSIQEIDDVQTARNGTTSVRAERQVSTLPSNGANFYYSGVASNTALPLAMGTGAMSGAEADDGWLSVSATPQGFSVMDAVGHTTFMNGAAPSPITAIAVDPSRYVAFMAVPDSNEVLSVNLPQ